MVCRNNSSTFVQKTNRCFGGFFVRGAYSVLLSRWNACACGSCGSVDCAGAGLGCFAGADFLPCKNFAAFRTSVKRLSCLASEAGAGTVLYQTWAYQDGTPKMSGTGLLQCNARVVPVGDVFLRLEAEAPSFLRRRLLFVVVGKSGCCGYAVPDDCGLPKSFIARGHAYRRRKKHFCPGFGSGMAKLN